jgi:uncharacterized alkaline shock family protein YloU
MSLFTNNKYGKISITDEVVAAIAGNAASDCYGVVEMVSRRFSDSLVSSAKKQAGKGVKVATVDNLIYAELYLVLKLGVNIDAVKKSISDVVKFTLEQRTGMRVKRVNVNVVGIRL